MADPLSISSSIIAILQLTGTVVGYINDSRGASEDRRKLLTEISSVSGILYLLKDSAERAQWDGTALNTMGSLSVRGGPLDQFKASLMELVTKLAPTNDHDSISGKVTRARRVLSWPFQKCEVQNILARIERQKTMFTLALQHDNLGLSRSIQEELFRAQDGIHTVNKALEEVKLQQTDRDVQDVLDWLSPLKFWAKQIDVFEKRHPETGTWLLQHDTFKHWLSGTRKRIFCPGIPGAGKTVLASVIVDHLGMTFRNDNVGIAYVYCSYNDSNQTAINLVGSLLHQFISTNRQHKLINEVNFLYKSHRGRNTRLSLKQLSELLIIAIAQFDRAFIIVDALDECREQGGVRQAFLDELQLPRQNVNLLATSRPIERLRADMSADATLEISASNTDVGRYLGGRIKHDVRLSRLVGADPLLKALATKTIIANAKGMFLLAQLHVDSLAKKQSRRAIRMSLRDLPKELNGIYDEAFRRIWSQGAEDISLARRVLSWIFHAQRPLTVAELQHALAVTLGESHLDKEALIDEDLLVAVCAGIVAVDGRSGIIRLVHHTTQEYLEQIRQDLFPTAHVEIARTCLTYLSFEEIASGLHYGSFDFLTQLRLFPFVGYAYHFWSLHLGLAADEEAEEQAFRFFRDDRTSTLVGNPVAFWPGGHPDLRYRPSQYNKLHIAATYGLKRLSQLLVELTHEDLNMQDDFGRTPISIAASKGHLDLVDYFLSLKNLNINAGLGSRTGTVLHVASACGHTEIVCKVLELGGNVASSTVKGLTALHIAAGKGRIGIIRLLLTAGSDARAVSKDDTTPLYHAARSGSLEALKLLVKEDGNINGVKGWEYSTPLHEAVAYDHHHVMQYLIDVGADPMRKDFHGQTPLDLAKKLKKHHLVRSLQSAQLQSKGQPIKHLPDSSVARRTYSKDDANVEPVTKTQAFSRSCIILEDICDNDQLTGKGNMTSKGTNLESATSSVTGFSAQLLQIYVVLQSRVISHLGGAQLGRFLRGFKPGNKHSSEVRDSCCNSDSSRAALSRQNAESVDQKLGEFTRNSDSVGPQPFSAEFTSKVSTSKLPQGLPLPPSPPECFDHRS